MVGSKVGMSKSKHCCPPYPILLPVYMVHRIFYISWHTDAYFLSTSPSSLESADPEFDDYQRNFAVLETAAEKFLKDTKAFTDAVNSMCHVCLLFYEPTSFTVTVSSSAVLFTSGGSLAQHFSIIFHPIASEYDLLGKFPQAAHTIKNVDAYHTALEELRTSISPELELIESRVVGPMKEFQGIMKTIRKMITKREHKVSMPSSPMRSVHLFLTSLSFS